ncbi:5'-nucleotidase isoform X2 [Salmo salar]|uniref:5'-nucleotidase n=1 Tax=Salmo salar TaxID=8030 RepID=A0ABM3F076_SALSA|nr:5'-nucleotidase isoform X2 [Salmo salar]
MGVSESMKCLLFYLCICSHVSTVDAWELTLLHTNDVHARVEETSNSYGKCTKPPCFAGVARRFTKIQEIRSREKNVMLLDAGDQFQGTVWFNVYKGAEAAYFMNKLGYDAMALGNHEFDNNVEGLIKPFLQEVKCTVLSANIKADDTLAPHISGLYFPYKIFDVGSQKVGVVGYTSKETPALSQTGPNLVFEDEIDALQPQVDKLITLGVNKIIALGHSGFVTDKEIAKRVKGVDVVIGGHSNTFLYTGEKPSSEVPAGPYPVMVKSEDGRDVPVVQAFAFGKYLGYLKVTFDEAGNVVQSTGNPILLDSSVPEDPSILADVNEWKKALANYSSQYVGETLVYLNGTFEECRFRECNLGNLICDAMVHHNIKYADELQWNHVSSCIIQGGSIRSSIDERSRNGFHVEYDMSRPPGERARSISVLCTNCRVPVYEPLDDSRLYKVVLPSYLVEGGDGFSMIKEEKLKHDSGDMDISVVASYITERKKVHPAVEGRIKISNSNSGGSGHTTLLILIGLVIALSRSL